MTALFSKRLENHDFLFLSDKPQGMLAE